MAKNPIRRAQKNRTMTKSSLLEGSTRAALSAARSAGHVFPFHQQGSVRELFVLLLLPNAVLVHCEDGDSRAELTVSLLLARNTEN